MTYQRRTPIEIDELKRSFSDNTVPYLGGYAQASADYNEKILAILEKAKTFTQLKKQLTTYCTKRQDFIDVYHDVERTHYQKKQIDNPKFE